MFYIDFFLVFFLGRGGVWYVIGILLGGFGFFREKVDSDNILFFNVI